MTEVEFIPFNLSTGYGANNLQLKQKNGDTQKLNYKGVLLSGELSLGGAFKEEEEKDCQAKIDGTYITEEFCKEAKENGSMGRVKNGIKLVNARADAMFGQGNDNYLRFALDIGPVWNYDFEYYNSFRRVVGFGVAGRLEVTRTSLPEGQNISGHNWSIDFPLAFGLGTKNVFLQDKLNLMIQVSESPASFKMRNEASLSYRVYANYFNKYCQTVDISAGNVYELGLIDHVEQKNLLWYGGVTIGLSGGSYPYHE
jgi:hypothetical protein